MRALITGITGTLGTEVTKQLLELDCNIVGYSRDEQKQGTFPYAKSVTMYLGCVRDQARLLEASRGIDIIFHFAAMKCIDKAEDNPEESILTNIMGTWNVCHAQRMNRIPKIVLASTDKAVLPINVYGACKLIAERLVLRNKANVVCRYGNVIASRGSVVPAFINSIQKFGSVDITDQECTRFWITPKQAAQFVVNCGVTDLRGVQIPKMKSSFVVDIAKVIGKILNQKFSYNYTKLRAGEKLHESITLDETSLTSDRYTDKELEKLLSPIVGEHK